ncbi:Phosphoenolpyruvate/pyruvate domain-containing protein [Rhizodiscina lignyota]|uniref:Phosphoenolpyruvate/pyruvate domain-containing protein n=1 Tax=Rhizodiscina lignyota TaxID=1504668 RepID=A0A9P4IQH7_9PEZI|nr:Phosphoenolpyruvate/pyruvate domain-containing protein [Rhizodiscina lignyota]
MTGPKSAAARLHELLSRDGKITICPGVYDGLTARLALREGFDCLYVTGAGTAVSRLGMPDLGVITLNEMLENAAMIASLDRTVPVIADADTGYGGPIMVARTVKSYITAGIAAMHLEDQVQTKRCGHLAGKELVDEETFLSRIRAAVLAREEMRQTLGQDIVLIARTDALQQLGYSEACGRLRKAIEIGADVGFLEGPTSLDQCRQICIDLAPTPVLLNSVPGGATPHMTSQEAQQMGFKLIIYPGLALTAVYESTSAACAQLKGTGDMKVTERQKQEGVKGLFNAVGLVECVKFDKAAGGFAFAKGV